MGGDQGLMRWGPRKRLAPSLAGEERGLLSSCTPQGRPQGDSEKEAVSVPGTEPSSKTPTGSPRMAPCSDLPSLRNCENECLLLKPLDLWLFCYSSLC